ICAGLESVEGVAGRMERIDAGQPFGVIVDFAHSPAALEKVLDVLAPLAAAQGGGLIVVFGSAGDRDTAKRPLMRRVAGERARLVVLAGKGHEQSIEVAGRNVPWNERAAAEAALAALGHIGEPEMADHEPLL